MTDAVSKTLPVERAPQMAPRGRGRSSPTIRLLIVTSFSSLEGFLLPMENRTLVWGLDQANVRWSLYNPWTPAPDLARYDAVLISVYRWHSNNFIYHTAKFEQLVRARGMPLINTVTGSEGLHSFYLGRWQAAGVQCGRFQRFQTSRDLTLDCYPLILRRDGMHRGAGMLLVNDRREAEQAITTQHAKSIKTYPNLSSGSLPVDLAIEFVRTQAIDGYFCKWRSYVVGDEVIPAHFMRSLSPFVNYKDASLRGNTCSIDQIFQMEGEPFPERVRAAARVLGFDILAVDYGLLPDGSYIFFEGNRVRATAGDAHVKWLAIRDSDLRFGAAVARLVRERVEAALPQSGQVVRRTDWQRVRPPASAFISPADTTRPLRHRRPVFGGDAASVRAEIEATLRPIRALARDMNWSELARQLEDTDLSVKGKLVTAAEVGNLLRVLTAGIHRPDILIDEVISVSTTATGAAIRLRIAAVGERRDGGGRDGLILEVDAHVIRDGEAWRLDRLAVDCPPEWAIWNARPNPMAPIDYRGHDGAAS